MNSSTIHPDLQQTAKRAPSMKLTRGNLWLWRFLTNLRRMSKFPESVVVEDCFIPAEDKQRKIRLRTYRPKSTVGLLPGLVWFHGGGLVIGRPEIDDALCVRFVQEAGIVVISVQYRYAPEHPFPAGLEDAYTALKWTRIQGRQIGVDPNRIGVGGESAGGCIAAALAQMAHDRNEIPLKTQHLIYPMLDDRSSIHPDLPDDSLIWNKQSNRFGWEAYLGKSCGSPDLPAYAVPARRTDLTGLPPAWIGVGAIDLFHAENTAYANRLRECGVDCTLHIVDGAFHGFDALAPQLQVSDNFHRAQTDWLKETLFAGKRIFTAVDMIPGRTYRVVRAFRDFDKSLHDVGESWIFVNKNFLPYDDGLTISVEQGGKPRLFRMQWREAEQGEVIDKFSDHVEEE
jgi:acetyl esterase/lipase